MSWNRTVTCSECYNTGHNKNGCPRRKERYEAALAVPEEDRGYSERRIIQDFEYKKERNSSRKCSYCDEQGHNRRSCTKLKGHFAHIAEMNRAYRTKMVEWVQEQGVNVGALLRTPEKPSSLSLVTGITWDYLNIWQGEIPRFVLAKFMNALEDRYSNQYTIPDNPDWPTGADWKHSESYSARSYAVEVVGPVSIPATAPAGWAEDTQPVKEYFKDRTFWQWTEDASHYNSHDWWKLDGEAEKKQDL